MSTKQQQDNELLANERIDAAVDKLLKAAGSALRHYMPSTVIDMRETMRGIMSESYSKGSNDAVNALKLVSHEEGIK